LQYKVKAILRLPTTARFSSAVACGDSAAPFENLIKPKFEQ
jgi:hypothetical protein